MKKNLTGKRGEDGGNEGRMVRRIGGRYWTKGENYWKSEYMEVIKKEQFGNIERREPN